MPKSSKTSGLAVKLQKDFKRNYIKYLMITPVLIYLLLFAYKPMYGILIAFRNYRPMLGTWGSPYVGLQHFETFFNDINFTRLLRNTFTISGLSILFGFPAPIILALLLNELKNQKFKRVVQTVTYMPYFISLVVVCGLIKAFTATDGLFNDIVAAFGGERANMLINPKLFYPIYVTSGIWQGVGWGSIIYLAALSSIDPALYEAAKIDGANRFHQVWYVSIPGIMPTIIVLFILQMGSILNVGSEKILLLYQPLTYEVADVINTYVYRKGIIDASFSYSTAIGLFNSVVNVTFLLITNQISRKVNQYGLI